MQKSGEGTLHGRRSFLNRDNAVRIGSVRHRIAAKAVISGVFVRKCLTDRIFAGITNVQSEHECNGKQEMAGFQRVATDRQVAGLIAEPAVKRALSDTPVI